MRTKKISPDGPVDVAKRPIGKCDCGRWEDSKVKNKFWCVLKVLTL